jgi:flagellar biosynthesis/type III secretory pathway chaperone
MDNNGRLRDMLAVVGRLITLMDQESALLRAMRTDQIGQFQEEKSRLAGLYVGMVKDLKRSPELLVAVDAAVRAELASALKRFDQATAENARMIAAARSANERVLRAVISAAQARRAPAGYAADGAAAKPPKPQRSTAISIAVDRRI